MALYSQSMPGQLKRNGMNYSYKRPANQAYRPNGKPKRPVSARRTARFRAQNGAFCMAERHVSLTWWLSTSYGSRREQSKKFTLLARPFIWSKKRGVPKNSPLWTWRESNPRPNRETIRFLHAYSGLRFSCDGKTRTTNRHLIP